MTKTKEEWLEVHLRALPKEVMNLLDITDLTKCSLEETELFKIVLKKEVDYKYKDFRE